MDSESTAAGARRDGIATATWRDLPRTIYLFLGLLILTYVLPPLLQMGAPSVAKSGRATPEGELSDKDFERYLSAENSVRLAGLDSDTQFGFPVKGRPGGASNALDMTRDARRAELSDAVSAYAELSKTTLAPNMDRRVLILDHVLNRPLNTATLTQSLPANLRLDHRSSADIKAELDLWRSLYAPTPSTAFDSPTVVEQSVRRIKAMHLRFLGDLALADLYHAAGRRADETAARKRMRQGALRAEAGALIEGSVLVFGALLGFVLLIIFFVAARTRRWHLVSRLATAPLHLSFGALMDAFVFYLTIGRTLGLVASAAIATTQWQPDPHAVIGLEVALQVATGAGAVIYVSMRAAAARTTLADIGLTSRSSVLGDIGYGVLGYCANLPLMFVAGLVARAIFKHNTNTAPNPVLPLMVGTHDLFSRGLIFAMASIGAPLIEETFFRGVLFSGLRKRYGWSSSALISAICFAVVHPMQDWLPIFTLGFSFATMREMRQSLIPSTTAHFLQNTLSFVFITLLFS